MFHVEHSVWLSKKHRASIKKQFFTIDWFNLRKKLLKLSIFAVYFCVFLFLPFYNTKITCFSFFYNIFVSRETIMLGIKFKCFTWNTKTVKKKARFTRAFMFLLWNYPYFLLRKGINKLNKVVFCLRNHSCNYIYYICLRYCTNQ